MRRAPAGVGGRGFTLPMVCLMIAVMTGPIMLMLALAGEEKALSRRDEAYRRALGAAEYGAWEWLTRCGNNEPAFRPAGVFGYGATEPWTAEPLAGRLDGVGYRVTARLLPDTDDADGDPATPVVLFNRSFGYAASPLVTGGYPLADVESTATVGESRATVRVLAVDRPLAPPGTAAVIAAGRLCVGGPALIEGLVGEVVSVAAGEVAAGEGVDLVHGTSPVPDEVRACLDHPATLFGIGRDRWANIQARRSPPEDGRFAGVVVLDTSYRGRVNGTGVLVVHNPQYDPTRYHASVLRGMGEFTGEYDPEYSHLDPGNQPALLDLAGMCDYTGVIVADEMRAGSASVRLRGQLILIGRQEQVLEQAGGISVSFDRGAIREHAHGMSDLILGWRRVR